MSRALSAPFLPYLARFRAELCLELLPRGSFRTWRGLGSSLVLSTDRAVSAVQDRTLFRALTVQFLSYLARFRVEPCFESRPRGCFRTWRGSGSSFASSPLVALFLSYLARFRVELYFEPLAALFLPYLARFRVELRVEPSPRRSFRTWRGSGPSFVSSPYRAVPFVLGAV